MNIPESILSTAERVELRLRKLYAESGYRRFRMARFEPYDFYAAHMGFLGGRILTFTDTDGRLMALKPDVTLSIIKNYRGGEEKISYTEKVYRDTGSSGEFREISETGIERLGTVDEKAQTEVLSLARASLELISLEHILDVAHVGYISGLLKETKGRGSVKKELLRLVRTKNAAGVRALDLDAGVSSVWEFLAEAYGDAATVSPSLAKMSLNEDMSASAAELAGTSEGANVDFSIISDMNYYNGLVFKGYVPGTTEAVISGGRYDGLVRSLGGKGGAIGFAVYLDSINGEEA